MPKITEMYAFIVEDGGPDDEGVPAFLDPESRAWMPLVGADLKRVDSLRRMAQQIATVGNKPLRLVRFTNLEEIEIVQPQRGKE